MEQFKNCFGTGGENPQKESIGKSSPTVRQQESVRLLKIPVGMARNKHSSGLVSISSTRQECS